MPGPDRHSPTLLAALRDVVAWLETPAVHGIVIGAIAASLHGRSRMTAEIDGLVVREQDDVAPLEMPTLATTFEAIVRRVRAPRQE